MPASVRSKSLPKRATPVGGGTTVPAGDVSIHSQRVAGAPLDIRGLTTVHLDPSIVVSTGKYTLFDYSATTFVQENVADIRSLVRTVAPPGFATGDVVLDKVAKQLHVTVTALPVTVNPPYTTPFSGGAQRVTGPLVVNGPARLVLASRVVDRPGPYVVLEFGSVQLPAGVTRLADVLTVAVPAKYKVVSLTVTATNVIANVERA